jgi:hypothetical protein
MMFRGGGSKIPNVDPEPLNQEYFLMSDQSRSSGTRPKSVTFGDGSYLKMSYCSI